MPKINLIRTLRKLFKWSLIASIVLLLLTMVCYVSVEKFGGQHVYTELDNVPKNKVGLLLGTSKYLSSGYQNLYFKYRIDAAVQLFKAGKIDYIIVSGDNGTKEYNEPREMMRALIAAGVPENRIQPDFAGFRTFDSVVRCRKVFGQEEFTVISQPFHNERAVFIARVKGIRAVGFSAKDVKGKNGLKTQIREVFARVKVFIDLITLKEPKFLGEEIIIGEEG